MGAGLPFLPEGPLQNARGATTTTIPQPHPRKRPNRHPKHPTWPWRGRIQGAFDLAEGHGAPNLRSAPCPLMHWMLNGPPARTGGGFVTGNGNGSSRGPPGKRPWPKPAGLIESDYNMLTTEQKRKEVAAF